MIATLADIAYTYAALIVIAIGFVYAFFAAGRWSRTMLPDAGLMFLYCWRPSLGMLVFVLLIGATRHTPRMADELSAMCRLSTFDGWTDALIRFLLPAMSSASAPAEILREIPRTVPVPSTSTTPQNIPDADAEAQEWVTGMAAARKVDGSFRFSASKIFAAVGGHRATVLATVKAIQEPDMSAQYREGDGSTAPAEYPVSRGAAP